MFVVSLVRTEGVPYDGVPSEEYVTIALPVTVIFMLLNIIGIICAVISLLFNAIFHNKRYNCVLAITVYSLTNYHT